MNRPKSKVAFASLLGLVFAFACLSGQTLADDKCGSVEVQGVQVVGDVVAVQVVNLDKDPMGVTLFVTVDCNGQMVTSKQELLVPPMDSAQSATFFDSDVDGVITVGLSDDSVPI